MGPSSQKSRRPPHSRSAGGPYTNSLDGRDRHHLLQREISFSFRSIQFSGPLNILDIATILMCWPRRPNVGQVVPEALQIAARPACLKARDEEQKKAVRILTKRLANARMALANCDQRERFGAHRRATPCSRRSQVRDEFPLNLGQRFHSKTRGRLQPPRGIIVSRNRILGQDRWMVLAPSSGNYSKPNP